MKNYLIYIVCIYAEGGESMSDFCGKHSFLGLKRGGVRTFLIGFFSIGVGVEC